MSSESRRAIALVIVVKEGNHLVGIGLDEFSYLHMNLLGILTSSEAWGEEIFTWRSKSRI